MSSCGCVALAQSTPSPACTPRPPCCWASEPPLPVSRQSGRQPCPSDSLAVTPRAQLHQRLPWGGMGSRERGGGRALE